MKLESSPTRHYSLLSNAEFVLCSAVWISAMGEAGCTMIQLFPGQTSAKANNFLVPAEAMRLNGLQLLLRLLQYEDKRSRLYKSTFALNPATVTCGQLSPKQ
jgi:hypothetical protein